jgi:hypothetical protein
LIAQNEVDVGGVVQLTLMRGELTLVKSSNGDNLFSTPPPGSSQTSPRFNQSSKWTLLWIIQEIEASVGGRWSQVEEGELRLVRLKLQRLRSMCQSVNGGGRVYHHPPLVHRSPNHLAPDVSRAEPPPAFFVVNSSVNEQFIFPRHISFQDFPDSLR